MGLKRKKGVDKTKKGKGKGKRKGKIKKKKKRKYEEKKSFSPAVLHLLCTSLNLPRPTAPVLRPCFANILRTYCEHTANILRTYCEHTGSLNSLKIGSCEAQRK